MNVLDSLYLVISWNLIHLNALSHLSRKQNRFRSRLSRNVTVIDGRDRYCSSTVRTLADKTNNRNVIFLILVPSTNIIPENNTNISFSSNACLQSLQHSFNISEAKAEALMNSNMSLYALTAKNPIQPKSFFDGIPAAKFIGNVRAMLRCTAQQNTSSHLGISMSTRKTTVTEKTKQLDPNQIVFTTVNQEGLTSPWGDLGVKTTRIPVDLSNLSTPLIRRTKPNSAVTFSTSPINSTTLKSTVSTKSTKKVV